MNITMCLYTDYQHGPIDHIYLDDQLPVVFLQACPLSQRLSSISQVLSPTYKQRNEDFRKLFKQLPDTERLIVGEWKSRLASVATPVSDLYFFKVQGVEVWE